jgi:hypothetical protein
LLHLCSQVKPLDFLTHHTRLPSRPSALSPDRRTRCAAYQVDRIIMADDFVSMPPARHRQPLPRSTLRCAPHTQHKTRPLFVQVPAGLFTECGLLAQASHLVLCVRCRGAPRSIQSGRIQRRGVCSRSVPRMCASSIIAPPLCAVLVSVHCSCTTQFQCVFRSTDDGH